MAAGRLSLSGVAIFLVIHNIVCLFVNALGDAKNKGESDTAADPKARSCTQKQETAPRP